MHALLPLLLLPLLAPSKDGGGASSSTPKEGASKGAPSASDPTTTQGDEAEADGEPALVDPPSTGRGAEEALPAYLPPAVDRRIRSLEGHVSRLRSEIRTLTRLVCHLGGASSLEDALERHKIGGPPAVES